MVKTTSAAMDTHLTSEVTSLAMATVIERTDGVVFRLTTSSEDIVIDTGDGSGPQSYLASEGVARTNIENDGELNVDNLDILGVFDNVVLKDQELRRGLFDFAEFKIFVFNHRDAADGIVKIFRGQLGEVIVTTQGYFKVTVRSIVQVYSKETGEEYSKDCRADLGDVRCTVPVLPNELTINTTVSLGETYIIPTVPDIAPVIAMNFEGADGSTSGDGFVNIGTAGAPDSIISNAQIDTAQAPAGGDSTSSLLLDGNLDRVVWNDSSLFTIGANPFTIHTDFRLASLNSFQHIASHMANASDRSWELLVRNTNVLTFVSRGPDLSTINVTIIGTTALTTGVDYHVAVTKDSSNNYRLFLDGIQESSTVNTAVNIGDSTGRLSIGSALTSFELNFLHGWVDSFEFFIGTALWTSNFTPPTGNLTLPAPSERTWGDYGDRAYEVTTAGVTGVNIAAPNQTVGVGHSQGGAVLTANHSWMRFAEVTAVSVTEPRRTFTVTELTPNSGQSVGANRLPSSLGFPDDWFNGGGVLFEGGDNAGVALEVRDFTADDGVTITQDIELITDLPFDIQVGDVLRLFPGCDKTAPTCINKFNNAINAVAEWFVPGEDILGQYPDAR